MTGTSSTYHEQHLAQLRLKAHIRLLVAEAQHIDQEAALLSRRIDLVDKGSTWNNDGR
jgi:hypothetical protein